MTVKLMLTCLCDAFYGEVGIATVRVLEHAGCKVEFPKGQTCCGQPPFNAGDWESARTVARGWRGVFEDQSSNKPQATSRRSRPRGMSEANGGDIPVVTPSSSCAAMIREGYPLMFGFEDHQPVFELSEFLVDRLGIEKWPIGFAPEPARMTRIAFHQACHGRSLGLRDQQVKLLSSIPGIEVVPIGEPEQCCGFGGAFSIGHPTVSSAIGDRKLDCVAKSGTSILVSGDMGCLMHLRGLIEKEGRDVETRHFAEILADAIPMKVST